MNTNTGIPGAWDRSAFGGVALIVLGLMAIIFPVAASITTTYVVGWVLIAAAFTHLLLGWRGDNAGSMVPERPGFRGGPRRQDVGVKRGEQRSLINEIVPRIAD